jgi:hypothetical protein
MKRNYAISSSIALTLAAVAVLVLHMRANSGSGFRLVHNEAFRFEPQPLAMAAHARRPMVGSSIAGGLYALTVEGPAENSALQLRMSHDGGEHWMAPERLTAANSAVNASSENAPQLISHAMYTYALWLERSTSHGSRILVARSTGMDDTSPVGVPVTDPDPTSKAYAGFASLGLAPNGDVYVVWLDGRDKSAPGTFNVYLARSTDKGLSFHKNVKVATDSCPCCRPSIAFGPDGKVYVAYRHVYSDNERDVAVATSEDSGDHFRNPVRVNLDRWHLLGCPESGPVLAVQNGRLIVVWYSAGSNRAGLRLAQSTDGGRSFRPPFAVDSDVTGANHPYLATTDDGRVALTFSGRTPSKDGSWGPISSFIVSLSPDGEVTVPQRVPDSAAVDGHPTVTLDTAGNAFVATTSGHEDSSTAYLSRATLVR